MKVSRLQERHAPALEELLVREPLPNLFLLSYMDAVPLGRGYWYGALDDDRLLGVALLVPGRLLVPYSPDRDAAAALGLVLRRRHRPTMLVGPRAACDRLWDVWAPDADVDRWHDQRLYVCTTPSAREPMPGFRRAQPAEWAPVAEQSAAMEWEDIGRRALEEDAAAYHRVVQRRIEQGQTWVVERRGEIVFQINVGTVTPFGVQVGGTYVPPAHRGAGLAKAGMAELCRRLLGRHPAVTLHVNEANIPAVRAYEGSGFVPDVPFRLATLKP